MMILSTLLTLALPIVSNAAPLESREVTPSYHPLIPRINICNLPIISNFVCNQTQVELRTTPLGLARGIQTDSGAVRFVVKYASAARFSPPSIATSWALPWNLPDRLPPLCPQNNGVDPSTYSEDCLYLTMYAPPGAHNGQNLPVFVWIHGGSYTYGSASDPGLDGSKLAISMNALVVVPQYRLGILGYLPPTSKENKNLGVRDMVTALQYIKLVASSFGADASKVTIAGQSSGANMVRNLLATPSASSLFIRGILHSDPMNYGFLQQSSYATMQTYYYNQVNCGSCLTTPLSTLLAAQQTLSNNALGLDPAVGMGEPIRPLLDGQIITTSLTTSFPSTNKPLLVTNVEHEAAPTVYQALPVPVPGPYLAAITQQNLGASRAAIVLASSYYTYDPSTDTGDGVRDVSITLGTDYIWRCPGWTFARNWASRSGTVYVGEYTLGINYPDNSQFPNCANNSKVCHQNDIEILFGTGSSPSPDRVALTSEVQSRWAAFANNGNPNVSGKPNWSSVPSNGAITALNLGGTTPIATGACDPSFWGATVQYDYQIFGQ